MDSNKRSVPPQEAKHRRRDIIVALVLISTAMGAWQVFRYRGASDAASLRPPHLLRLSAPHPLPVIRFLDESGNALSLERLRGKALLLNVWATWCGPCRKEMPALDRVQARFGGPNFEVIALAADVGGIDAVRAFYTALKIENLAIYVDKDLSAMRALGVTALPTTLLVDPRGREIARSFGAADWESREAEAAIHGLLGKPLAELKDAAGEASGR